MPQCSLLGPLLFNIVSNDLFLLMEDTENYNYAYDLNDVGGYENERDCIFYTTRSMRFNSDKCQLPFSINE